MEAERFNANAVAFKVNKLLERVPTTTDQKERFDLRRELKWEIPNMRKALGSKRPGTPAWDVCLDLFTRLKEAYASLDQERTQILAAGSQDS